MNTRTERFTRDDMMGMTIAVLMFVLQGCMVLAMSKDQLIAGEAAAVHGKQLAAHADSTHPARPA